MPTQPPPKEKECEQCNGKKFIPKLLTTYPAPAWGAEVCPSCSNPSKEETNRQWAEELLTIGNEPDEYIPYKQDRETLIRRVADALSQAFERGKKEGREEFRERVVTGLKKVLATINRKASDFAAGQESGFRNSLNYTEELDKDEDEDVTPR